MAQIKSPEELEKLRQEILSGKNPSKPCISVCAGSSCLASGAGEVIAAFKAEIEKQGLKAEVDTKGCGCPGLCEKGPVVIIYPEEICYLQVTPDDVPEIVAQTVVGKKVIDRLLYTDPKTNERAAHVQEISFYQKQERLLIGDNAKIDPKSIDDYLSIGGYSALGKVLGRMSPEEVIEEINKSGLREEAAADSRPALNGSLPEIRGYPKYIICNCHEGDPVHLPIEGCWKEPAYCSRGMIIARMLLVPMLATSLSEMSSHRQWKMPG